MYRFVSPNVRTRVLVKRTDFPKMLNMKCIFVIYPVAIGTCRRSVIIRMWNSIVASDPNVTYPQVFRRTEQVGSRCDAPAVCFWCVWC
jgi:hypothetical protein